MNIPSVILSVLLGVTLVALFLGWRHWRAPRVRARALTPRLSNNPQSQALRSAASAHAPHDPLAMEPGVWRPPPRQQLMRRQTALLHAVAEPPTDRLRVSSARRLAGDPRQRRQAGSAARMIEDSPLAPTEPSAMDQELARPIDGANRARLGRQRQGLESLITDIPSANEGHRHEPDAH